MIRYRVYWHINDGHRGMPNIESIPYGMNYCNIGYRAAMSYEEALDRHFGFERELGKWRGRITDIVEIERGRTNGVNHRIYRVTYRAVFEEDRGPEITRDVKVTCWRCQ